MRWHAFKIKEKRVYSLTSVQEEMHYKMPLKNIIKQHGQNLRRAGGIQAQRGYVWACIVISNDNFIWLPRRWRFSMKSMFSDSVYVSDPIYLLNLKKGPMITFSMTGLMLSCVMVDWCMIRSGDHLKDNLWRSALQE